MQQRNPSLERSPGVRRTQPPWPVLGCHLDSIGLRLPRRRGDDLDTIQEEDKLRSAAFSVHVAASGSGSLPPRHTRVVLHRPTANAIELADDLILRYRGIIQEAHVAIEIRGRDVFEAERIRDWLALHLRRRWGREPWVFADADECGTYYTSPKAWNIDRHTLYARDSKLQPGTAVVRLERQLCGPRLVRRGLLGVERPTDILDLNPVKLILDGIEFEEPDLAGLGRQHRGRSRAKKPDVTPLGRTGRFYDRDLQTGAGLSAWAAVQLKQPSSWVEASAGAIRAAFRDEPWFTPNTCMQPLPLPLVVTSPTWSFPPLSPTNR